MKKMDEKASMQNNSFRLQSSFTFLKSAFWEVLCQLPIHGLVNGIQAMDTQGYTPTGTQGYTPWLHMDTRHDYIGIHAKDASHGYNPRLHEKQTESLMKNKTNVGTKLNFSSPIFFVKADEQHSIHKSSTTS